MSEQSINILAVAGKIRPRSRCFYMMDLLRGLAKAGCEVTLVREQWHDYRPFADSQVTAIQWSDFLGRWAPLVSRAAMKAAFNRSDAQIVHVLGTELPLAGRSFVKHCGAPVVFTPYTAEENRAEIRSLGKSSHLVIALTEYMRQSLVSRARVPRPKFRIVPPGVDASKYPLHAPSADRRLAVIGTVGPLEAKRGQEVFLRAARQLLDSGRKAQFLIAGDGRAEQSLRKECESLGLAREVTFATRLTNYHSIIAGLDIFVRPAAGGALTYTVMEAMAMGKAIVATATGEVPELLKENETGLMVRKNDPQAIADAVRTLLDEPNRAREMGLAARRHVEENLSMDVMVKETMAVYAEAIKLHDTNGEAI